MKKIIFAIMFMLPVFALSQNSMVTLLSSHWHPSDTLYTSTYYGCSAWDSCKIWIATSDSVKVYVDKCNANLASGAIAYSSWVLVDSLVGTTDGGTSAPYGNMVTMVTNYATSPFPVKYRLRFAAVADGGGFYGTFKFGHWLKK